MGEVAAQSNRPHSGDDILPALLMEVRGLRAAMEHMASAGPRVQLALGRLQIQEQRINTLLRRGESVRDALSGTEREAATIQERMRNAERAIAGTNVTAEEREQLTLMLPGLKREAAAAAVEVQRLQAEEAQLQQQITAEQGRWSDINNALEELERAFGPR
jgi:predicted  nucleic acid-binding Zn-ribbon protein